MPTYIIILMRPMYFLAFHRFMSYRWVQNVDLMYSNPPTYINSQLRNKSRKLQLLAHMNMFAAYASLTSIAVCNDIIFRLESMDPNTERFENVSHHIHYHMSSYKAIYNDKKGVTTQSTLDMFVRCCSQQRQDDNSDDPDYPQPSTSRGVEVAREQHFSSQPSTSSAVSPTTEPN
jgi:hypothetical protein